MPTPPELFASENLKGVPLKKFWLHPPEKVLEESKDFSNAIHLGCVDIFWNSPFLRIFETSIYAIVI